MRVSVATAGFLLTSALVSISVLAAIRPAQAHTSKVTCICEDDQKAKAVPARRSAVRKAVRPVASRPATRQSGGYYDYGSASPYRSELQGEWRAAPTMGSAYSPPPGAYEQGAEYGSPPEGNYDETAGLQVDRGGWSGGVGGDPEGGGGGGGGFGQLHFGLGGNQENGPTYNNYNQSFQYNPSQAAPFRPRLMGGFAPPAK